MWDEIVYGSRRERDNIGEHANTNAGSSSAPKLEMCQVKEMEYNVKHAIKIDEQTSESEG